MLENTQPEKKSKKKEKNDPGEHKKKELPTNPDGTTKSKGQIRAERRLTQV